MNPKHFLSLFAGLAAVFGLAAAPALAAEPTAEKPLRLTLSTTFMDKHAAVAGGLIPWMEEIKERTGGRVLIEYFNPNTICAEGDIYDAVRSGVLDIGGTNVTRNKGKFPLASLFDQPFVFSTATSASVASWRLAQEFPALAKEFDETHLLTLWGGAASQLSTSGKEIKTLDDLKGLKIATFSAAYLDLAQALGASAISVSPTDVYLALQRGQADAVIAPFAYMRSTKIFEGAKKSFVADMNTSGFYLAMNKDTWNALPDDIKQIFTETTGEALARRIGAATDKSNTDDLEFIRQQGQQVFAIEPAEVERWRAKAEPLLDAWVKDCQSHGHGFARAMLERARALDAELVAGQTAAQ